MFKITLNGNLSKIEQTSNRNFHVSDAFLFKLFCSISLKIQIYLMGPSDSKEFAYITSNERILEVFALGRTSEQELVIAENEG